MSDSQDKSDAKDKVSKRAEHSQRPVAPAPLPVLLGVCASATVLLAAVSILATNDIWALVGCVCVILGAAALVDRAGRNEAERHPHPMYRINKLPSRKSPLKPLIVVATLLVLLLAVGATVEPNGRPSPFPYFLAAAFLFVVMPQILARSAMRKGPDH